jgi:hypothetical protein
MHYSPNCLCSSCKSAGNRRYVGGGVYNIHNQEDMKHKDNKEMKKIYTDKDCPFDCGVSVQHQHPTGERSKVSTSGCDTEDTSVSAHGNMYC